VEEEAIITSRRVFGIFDDGTIEKYEARRNVPGLRRPNW
jgi:hypothetical protein